MIFSAVPRFVVVPLKVRLPAGKQITRRDLLHDPKGLRANGQRHRSARASLISSSTKAGGVRAAIYRAISPFSARLSLNQNVEVRLGIVHEQNSAVRKF